MADDGGRPTAATETAALRDALAAEHTAVWGYGVVGAALGADRRAGAVAGVAGAWVRVLDQAAERSTRQLAVDVLGATEVRAVAWRSQAGKKPVTTPFP